MLISALLDLPQAPGGASQVWGATGASPAKASSSDFASVLAKHNEAAASREQTDTRADQPVAKDEPAPLVRDDQEQAGKSADPGAEAYAAAGTSAAASVAQRQTATQAGGSASVDTASTDGVEPVAGVSTNVSAAAQVSEAASDALAKAAVAAAKQAIRETNQTAVQIDQTTAASGTVSTLPSDKTAGSPVLLPVAASGNAAQAQNQGVLLGELSGSAPAQSSETADLVAWLKSLGLSAASGSAEGSGESLVSLAAIKSMEVPDAQQGTRTGLTRAEMPEAPFVVSAAQVPDSGRAAAVQAQTTVQHAAAPLLDEVAVQGVRYLVANGEKTITVRLVPPSLGELRLEVSTIHDQVNVRLISANPVVREALEIQAPGLREALIRSGIDVAKVTVVPGLAESTGGAFSGGFSPPFSGAPAPAPILNMRPEPVEPANAKALPVSAPHTGSLNILV